MSRFLVPLALIVALCVAACGPKEDKYAGTYVGQQQLAASAMSKISKSMQQSQQVSMTLNLNKDKSAELSVEKQPQPLKGTWSVQNDEIEISFGTTGALPMKLRPSDDGKTLTLDMGASAANSYGTIVFTRS